MTGTEMLDRLEKSGTGAAKLAPARDLVKLRPDAPTEEVVAALQRGGAAEGTIQKCSELMGATFAVEHDRVRPVFPVRCPPGGCRVGGRQFAPGEIIPPELVQRATPDEIGLLCAATTAISAQPIPAASPSKVTKK